MRACIIVIFFVITIVDMSIIIAIVIIYDDVKSMRTNIGQ